jgi:hypothetical protein
MDTPAFIFELLNKELQNIQEQMCREIALKYNLDFEEVSKPYLSIIKDKDEKIVICKKIKSKKMPTEEERCMARVWNRGKGGQCARGKHGDTLFCCQHGENRKHGTINEKPKREIFPRKTRIIYK